MAARDDTVIRGSLITCLIVLVLSLALNFFLWRWGDTSSQEASTKANQLRDAQGEIRNLQSQSDRLKAMLGFGSFTEAELKTMRENADADPEMAAIEEQFTTHMSLFGQEVDAQGRSYKTLPEYLVNAIRDRNQQYNTQVEAVEKIRADATASIEAAQKQQQLAEESRDEATKKMESLTAEFNTRREEMLQASEQTKDAFTKLENEYQSFRNQVTAQQRQLEEENRQRLATIETQKISLNRLRSTNYENVQGEIRYTFNGGNLVTINLGSADQLRPGVTFGVIDGEEKRLQDAKVKATIQVVQVQGPYLATARVVARPQIASPIIPGDKIYSPFWAPGRTVKIALAGDIDIDGDGKPDNEALKGQIKAAGAEVAAEVSMTGEVTGKLDPSVRFLVIGDDPEVSPDPSSSDEAAAAAVEAMGKIKARAAELGLTIIPAWKLQSYLKTIDDTLTTPLGSAVRAEDFKPEVNLRTSRQGVTSRVAEIYKQQQEGLQEDNKILPP